MPFKNKIQIIGFVLSVLMLPQGCDKTWDDHYNTLDITTQKDKVISELEKIPEISRFTEEVMKIDTLVDLLNQNRLYTVFAPVNESFETINAEILNNETLLVRMMLYHFIHGKFKYKDFSYDNIITFNNKNLNVSLDASNTVLFDNSATIVQKDFLSQNGIIQVIDRPFLPKDNLYEYFSYNTYSSQLAEAISKYTIKEFNKSASTPIGKNENNEVIFDSVFSLSNPFLSWKDINPSEYFYGKKIEDYIDIGDETGSFTFIFPENYETALDAVKNKPFLNKSISDHHWAGPILSDLLLSKQDPQHPYSSYFSMQLLSKQEYISAINLYHTQPFADTLEVLLYFADLLNSNYTGSVILSNGMVHLVDGFEYDPGWLIKEQGNMDDNDDDDDYLNDLMSKMTASDNVDSVKLDQNNIRVYFYSDSIGPDPESKYGEWINFDLEGDFYPVDYKILVRGRNFASGTFKVEADGKETGEYDFSTAPSGDNDTKFDEIGTVKFTETKSNTNLKFTFVKTHPGTTNEQYLWIREIKFLPVIN